MDSEEKKINNEEFVAEQGDEAYKTLTNWVKSVPSAIREIEENGTEEDLIRYKKQVSMIVEKLKEIEKTLPKKN